MDTWRRSIVLQWSAALALLVGVPWFRGGYVLSYDMVWVPRLELGRSDVWGLGTALPRAVPSDAVVALLGAVVDPQVVQRVVLVGALVLAATGGARLLRELGLPAQLAAATFALWNPFVAERLVLGQWPLLVAYGALFWLVAGLREDRRAVSTLALAATALSPATGLMGVVVAVVVGRRIVGPVVLGAILNAPWIAAALLNRDALAPDADAVRSFAVQPEGPFGRIGSVLGLGGIWNRDVVPDSRDLVLVAVIGVVLWVVMVLGVVELLRRERTFGLSLLVLGAVGLVVAWSGWWAPDLVERGIDAFGPSALLRDGTRFLPLLALLEVVALGHGVAWLVAWLRRTESTRGLWAVPAVLGVLLPLAALPDLANGVGGRLDPVDYPAGWTRAADEVSALRVKGDVLVLPFSAYRAPTWNDDRPVLDPAGRFFDRDTVTDDRLLVGGRTIAGEDPRARRIRAVLREPSDERDALLAAEGIGIVVSGTDTSSPQVRTVPGARVEPVAKEERWIMTGAFAAAGLVALLSLLGVLRRLLGR